MVLLTAVRCELWVIYFQEMRILTEVTRKVESDMLEYEGFFKEQLRNNMEIDIQTRYILRDTCNQQQINDKLTQELDTKMNEVK